MFWKQPAIRRTYILLVCCLCSSMFKSHHTHWLERQSSNGLFHRKLSFLLPIKNSRFKNMAVRYSFQRSRPKWFVPAIETCVLMFAHLFLTAWLNRKHFPPISTNSNEIEKYSLQKRKKADIKKTRSSPALVQLRNYSIITELFIVACVCGMHSSDWTSVQTIKCLSHPHHNANKNCFFFLVESPALNICSCITIN